MHELMVVEVDAENLKLGALLAKTMDHMKGFLLGIKGHSPQARNSAWHSASTAKTWLRGEVRRNRLKDFMSSG
jgi:hypothetical protein